MAKRTNPPFVTICDGYPVGRGDFVMVKFGSNGTQLARIHHWVNETTAMAYKYSANSNWWTKRLCTVEIDRIVCKVLRPVTGISKAPEVTLFSQ